MKGVYPCILIPEKFPEPTVLKDIVIEDEGAFISWIRFDTDVYNKTLTGAA